MARKKSEDEKNIKVLSEKEKGYENPEEEKITTNNDLTVFGLWDRFCKKRRRTRWKNVSMKRK